jgi:hypothetical protein
VVLAFNGKPRSGIALSCIWARALEVSSDLRKSRVPRRPRLESYSLHCQSGRETGRATEGPIKVLLCCRVAKTIGS